MGPLRAYLHFVSRGSEGPVPEPSSPTVRRKRLAAELRRLRERADLTGEHVADQMKWSASKLSRIENAHTTPRPSELKKLLLLYGVDGQYAEDLAALAQEANRKGWWKAYSDALPEAHAAYIALETEATSMYQWAPEVVGGLLQSEGYAREIIRTSLTDPAVPPGEIERMVEARLFRQKILEREPSFELDVVLDYSVLHRRIGSNDVMRAQLDRLLEVSEYANVKLSVLPLNASHPVITGGFVLLGFGEVHDVGYRDIVHIEHFTDSVYIEAERDTYQYKFGFGRLRAASLDPGKSRDEISRAKAAWA